MGGLIHLFDFHQGHMGRKQKKYGGGLEAPRNSLDLPAETSQSYYDSGNHTLQDLPRKKMEINNGIAKRSNKQQSAPSIVAKLMGMDILPSDTKSIAQPLEIKTERTGISVLKNQHTEKDSTRIARKKTKSSGEKEHHLYRNMYPKHWNSSLNFGKPKPRVHPQEKELQQFKKDFEAWQAARFLECARVVELSNIPEQWLAQLDLNKEKMVLYENSRRQVIEKHTEPKSNISKSRSIQSGGNHGYKKELFPDEHKHSYSFRSRSPGGDFDQLSLIDSDKSSDRSSAPTRSRIVILKPGPDSFNTNDESWVSSSCSVEGRDCIEDLLEEVKERLTCELQGKTLRKSPMVRGGGIETPYKEKPSYSRDSHQHFTKQVRESVVGEHDTSLHRSKSTRSYQSEIQLNEPNSPKFISRHTKKFLSDRLKNVLNGENYPGLQNSSCGSLSPSTFDSPRARLEQARDILNAEHGRHHWLDNNYDGEAQVRSFRHELNDERITQDKCSPRSLVRSLSAPVAGTSFGKLLLEDRHISTGAHIKRRHEALENGQKKERFNFREKVSSIKYSFTLKGRLFRRRFQSFDVPQDIEFDSMKDVESVSPAMTLTDRQENATEVPPSPASVCSYAHDELWKPADHPSPLSTSDVTSVGDHSVGNVFREISSNLNELRKQLKRLEYDGSEVTTITDDHSEAEVLDLEDEAEAYIRDLLVASGLYEGSWNQSFSRWDPFVKPISNWVFEKVEDTYTTSTNEDHGVAKDHNERILQHKLLFDLLNETLANLLRPHRILSKFIRRVSRPTMLTGKKLLAQVWEMISEYLYPRDEPSSYSLNDLMAHDLNVTPWLNLVDEEINVLGKELEYLITGEIIDEILNDMQL